MSDDKRRSLQTTAVILVAVGGLLFLIGFVTFASGMGDREIGDTSSPSGFGLAAVGAVLFGIGMTIGKFAFLKPIARFFAKEIGPEIQSATGQRTTCASCDATNRPDAEFCRSCGASMTPTEACPSCGAKNDSGARFCDSCGASLRMR